MINFNQFNSTNSQPYFTGTMILYQKDEDSDSNVFQLMDGQQRWTTLTALFGTIYHLIDSDGAGNDYTQTKNDIKIQNC